jgi:hypothetical protein
MPGTVVLTLWVAATPTEWVTVVTPAGGIPGTPVVAGVVVELDTDAPTPAPLVIVVVVAGWMPRAVVVERVPRAVVVERVPRAVVVERVPRAVVGLVACVVVFDWL